MRDRFRVAPGVSVPVSELSWRFGPSGGPGGQHANRASTRATVVFNVEASGSVPDEIKERLVKRFGPEIVVVEDDSRSQSRNREVAIERLEARISSALIKRRSRRDTRPTAAAVQRRLDEKRHRSTKKRDRRSDWDEP